MASGAVSIGGGIAVKQLMKKAKGGTIRNRRRRTARRSLGDYKLDGIDDFSIDDFGQEEFLGDEDDLLGDHSCIQLSHSY